MTPNSYNTFINKPTPKRVSTGDILAKAAQNESNKASAILNGKVTYGVATISMLTAGISWDYFPKDDYGNPVLLDFAYKYFQMPIFTFGVDGSFYGPTNPGTGEYGETVPPELQSTTTWSPAVIIPRVVHWNINSDGHFLGCLLVVVQVNPYSTEADNKEIRLHYRFEGPGELNRTNYGG